MDMWIARLTATFPHTHSPAKSQTFFDFGFNVKTDRSDSNLDWNLLLCFHVEGIYPNTFCRVESTIATMAGCVSRRSVVIA